MELGTTDPMTGEKKTLVFYPLLAISRKTYHDSITISNIAAKKNLIWRDYDVRWAPYVWNVFSTSMLSGV